MCSAVRPLRHVVESRDPFRFQGSVGRASHTSEIAWPNASSGSFLVLTQADATQSVPPQTSECRIRYHPLHPRPLSSSVCRRRLPRRVRRDRRRASSMAAGSGSREPAQPVRTDMPNRALKTLSPYTSASSQSRRAGSASTTSEMFARCGVRPHDSPTPALSAARQPAVWPPCSCGARLESRRLGPRTWIGHVGTGPRREARAAAHVGVGDRRALAAWAPSSHRFGIRSRRGGRGTSRGGLRRASLVMSR